MLRIFIGYDDRQEVSYTVAARSALAHASGPISIIPLRLEALKVMGFTRRGLTPFTFSRFLVPYLCDFAGPRAIFVDADVMWRGDPYALLASLKPESAVWLRGRPEFERSAVMVFDPLHPDLRTLTPQFVQQANPFNVESWTKNIGELSAEWHHLVLYDQPSPDAKLVHFTAGVPSFPELESCEHADEYRRHVAEATGIKCSWTSLMGQTQHAPVVAEWRKKQ